MDDQNSETRFVKLISADGFEITLDKEVAVGARTIKNMLSGSGTMMLFYLADCTVTLSIGAPHLFRLDYF